MTNLEKTIEKIYTELIDQKDFSAMKIDKENGFLMVEKLIDYIKLIKIAERYMGAFQIYGEIKKDQKIDERFIEMYRFAEVIANDLSKTIETYLLKGIDILNEFIRISQKNNS